MCWLKGEPKLRDVLADPVIQLMMRRDRVDPDHLHAFLRRVSDTLPRAAGHGATAPFTSPATSPTEMCAR